MSLAEAEVLAERARKMLADVGVDPGRVRVTSPASGDEGCEVCRRVVFSGGSADKKGARMFWQAGRLLHPQCVEECFECWWVKRVDILAYLRGEAEACPDHTL